MFKFCYNDNGLRDMKLIDAITDISKYGYDAVEISFHQNHIHPMHYDIKEVQNIKELCEELSLEIAGVAVGASDLLSDIPYEPSLINPNKEERKRRMKLLTASIDIAKELGTSNVIFASGKKMDGISSEEAMEVLCEEIKKLLAYEPSMTLLIEPEPDFFIGTTEAAIELIKKVNNDRFRMNLDLGHVIVCEEDYLNKIDKALPYAKHIHIEDIKDRVHYHLIPGTADMDFDKIFEMIKKHNYQGAISVELYNHNKKWKEALGESLSFLKQYK